MSSHVLILKDGTHKPIRDAEAAKRIMGDIEKGRNFYLGEDYISGTSVSHIDRVDRHKDVNQSSLLDIETIMLQLPATTEKAQFWQDILVFNHSQQLSKIKWVYESAVEYARVKVGKRDAQLIIEYIKEHEEEVIQFNQCRAPIG